MHYYQFNIGDYKSHTEHLTDFEDLAYRRMLDWYYLHETPLPSDAAEIARLIRMRSHTESIAVVLQEFFERTDKGWVNSRADQELAKAGEKSSKASMSAKSRWLKTKEKPKDADVMRTHNESNATHNTIHNTQDTINKTPPRKRSAPPKPADVDEQTWADWLSLRKTKRAPVTETVLRGARSEAAKAGISLEDFLRVWCRRGSQGLEASWLKDNERTPQKSFAQQERERGWARWEEMTGQQHPERLAHEGKAQGQVIDVTPSFLEIEQ